MAISSKTLRAILERACSARKKLNGELLSDFFEPRELAAWLQEMQRMGGPPKLVRLLNKEFGRRGSIQGSVLLVRSVPALHQCLMVVEMRPSHSVDRFYIGFTEEKFMTYKEPGV